MILTIPFPFPFPVTDGGWPVTGIRYDSDGKPTFRSIIQEGDIIIDNNDIARQYYWWLLKWLISNIETMMILTDESDIGIDDDSDDCSQWLPTCLTFCLNKPMTSIEIVMYSFNDDDQKSAILMSSSDLLQWWWQLMTVIN